MKGDEDGKLEESEGTEEWSEEGGEGKGDDDVCGEEEGLVNLSGDESDREVEGRCRA